MKFRYIIFVLFVFSAIVSQAQNASSSSMSDNPGNNSLKTFGLVAKAGLNIGAATPMSMPVEIREIKGFNPGFNGSIGVDAIMNIDSVSFRWVFSTGVYVEQLSMTTRARVKNYSTEISNNGNVVAGVWTGDVESHYSVRALTLPICLSYKPSSNFNVRAGVYVSFLFGKTFDGSVYDGYLREGNPTGAKVVFDAGSNVTYDFSTDLKNVQYGFILGADYNITSRLLVAAQLSYGADNIFNRDFKTINYTFHTLFLNLSVGYRLF